MRRAVVVDALEARAARQRPPERAAAAREVRLAYRGQLADAQEREDLTQGLGQVRVSVLGGGAEHDPLILLGELAEPRAGRRLRRQTRRRLRRRRAQRVTVTPQQKERQREWRAPLEERREVQRV